MRYVGFDMGDGESAVAAFEKGSTIEPVVWPVGGVKSVLSAVGIHQGEIVIGERAYTDALADNLSVRFKSRFTTDPASYEDVVLFVRGLLQDLKNSGLFDYDDQFVVGCPAGWNAACRARYRDLLIRAGIILPQVISESRAAFLYVKYAHTIALDIDILNESALVADIGSSTLDYAYIVDGRETGVGTFGENALGGGMLDAALLRRAVERSRDRDAIRAVFKECRSWYSYCEIEMRKLKEEYFTRLETEDSPVVKKQLRICYDGVQKLTLEVNAEEISHVTDEPLPELDGRTFTGSVRESLENAARLTADRPPEMLLLTGGASRMPFFRDLCQEIFDSAIVISCPEPEFSIAKGLAYAGWIDENLRIFRQTVQDEITETRISLILNETMPSLLPAVADLLAGLILEEAALPIAEQWRRGRIDTLEAMEKQIGERIERVLNSPLAQDALAPAVADWLTGLEERFQAIVDPICDEYDVPRKDMLLDLTAAGAGHVDFDSGVWSGLSIVKAVLGTILSLIGGMLCGGGGMALIASGPVGFAAGLAIGVIASCIGWKPMSDALLRLNLPLLLRQTAGLEKQLSSDQTRKELKKRLLEAISPEDSPFRTELISSFARSFRTYVKSLAEAAEIPIQ